MKKVCLVMLALLLMTPLNVYASDDVRSRVELAEEMGLIPDYLLADFELDDEITRVQYVELLWLTLLNTSEQIYTDTADIDYENTNAFADTYNYAIDDLFYIGVLSDTPNNKFYPAERVTRGDAALWLKRAAEYLGVTMDETDDGYEPDDTFEIGQAIGDVLALALLAQPIDTESVEFPGVYEPADGVFIWNGMTVRLKEVNDGDVDAITGYRPEGRLLRVVFGFEDGTIGWEEMRGHIKYGDVFVALADEDGGEYETLRYGTTDIWLVDGEPRQPEYISSVYFDYDIPEGVSIDELTLYGIGEATVIIPLPRE